MISNYQTLMFFKTASALLICFWAFFCVFYPRVNDGILGKVLFGLLGFSAIAVIVSENVNYFDMTHAMIVMNVFVAAVGVRHMWMKCFWDHIKAACARWAICVRLRGQHQKNVSDK